MGAISTDQRTVILEKQSAKTKNKGKLARMCQSKARTIQKNSWKNPGLTRTNLAKAGATPKKEAKWVSATTEVSQSETEPFLDTTILNIGSHCNNPITVYLELNGKEVLIKVDTGAAVTLMSETTHKKLFLEVKLKNSTVNLQTYTRVCVKVGHHGGRSQVWKLCGKAHPICCQGIWANLFFGPTFKLRKFLL